MKKRMCILFLVLVMISGLCINAAAAARVYV